MNVGTGDVNLKPANLLFLIKPLAGINVLLNREAGNISHNRLTKASFQLGKLLGDNLINARILQTDRIDHTHTALGDSGGGVTESGLLCSTLKGEGTKNVYVIKLGKLIAKAERARCGDDRIIKLDTEKIYT